MSKIPRVRVFISLDPDDSPGEDAEGTGIVLTDKLPEYYNDKKNIRRDNVYSLANPTIQRILRSVNIPDLIDSDILTYFGEKTTYTDNVVRSFEGLETEPYGKDSSIFHNVANLLGDDWYAKNGKLNIIFDRDEVLNYLNERGVSPELDSPIFNEDKDVETTLESLNTYKIMLDNPPKLPFENINQNVSFEYSDNCLIDILITRYNKNCSKRASISEKAINKYFKNSSKSVVTLGKLVEFCTKYGIDYLFKDILGRTIARNKFNKNNSRNALRGILFHNHIYEYTKDAKSKMILDYGTEKHNDKNIVYVEKPEDPNEYFEAFNTKLVQNFSYLSERLLHCTALCYDGINHEDYKGSVTYDMSKCYYQVMFNNDITPEDTLIPIFATTDIICKFDMKEIKPYSCVLLKKDSMKKIRIYGHNNNFMFGFNVLLFIDRGILSLDDIDFVKIPSYCIKVKNIRDVMDDLEDSGKVSNESMKQKQKLYRLCNGLLGKKYSSQTRTIVRIENDTCEDIAMLKRFNDGYECNDEFIPSNTVMRDENELQYTTRGNYLYLNSRSVYDFTVARSNWFINKTHLEVIEKNPSVYVYRIRTDSLSLSHDLESTHPIGLSSETSVGISFEQFTGSMQLPRETSAGLFHVESNKNSKGEYKHNNDCLKKFSLIYHDGEKLLNNIQKELSKIADNVQVFSGAPGSGKTFHIKKNKDYDIASTISNVCCRNMDTPKVSAQTVYSLLDLGKNDATLSETLNKMRNKTIWFDEFSMFDPTYYNYMYMAVKNRDAKIILSGDFNQIPPINFEKFYEKKLNFFNVFFKNTEIMAKDYRNSIDLIEFRDMITNYPDESPEVYEALRNLKSEDDFTKFDVHLVRTHKVRDYVNNAIIKKRGLLYDPKNNNISKGVRLVATQTVHDPKDSLHPIYKSAIYVVRYIGKISVRLYNETLDREETHNIGMLKMFTLGYAVTVHSSQGLTIKVPFCIHNPRKMYKQDKAILYTAVTRGTTLKNIIFKVTETAVNPATILNGQSGIDSKFKNKQDNYIPTK